MANNTYSFGSSTYTYLWTLPIEDAVTSLIAQGFGELEVMASGRHLEQLTVPRVQKVISQNVVGLNPPGLDLNLVSVEEEWRRASVNHYESIIDVAGALDATYVVVVPGRAHPLSPAPKEFLEDSLRTALDRLARRADSHGVSLALENTPNGYLGSVAELVAFHHSYDDHRVAMCIDVANAYFKGDLADALDVTDDALVVHLSDSGEEIWDHAPIGSGTVPWKEVLESKLLKKSRFKMLETIHPLKSDSTRTAPVHDVRRLATYS